MAKAAAKIKITDIAKNFGMAGKDMLALIKDFGIDKKSSTSGLEAEELNLVFEHMLNRLTVEGDIEPLLTKGVSSVEEKKDEKAPKDEQSEKPEQAEEKAPSKKKKQRVRKVS